VQETPERCSTLPSPRPKARLSWRQRVRRCPLAPFTRDTRLPELVSIGKDLQQALRLARDGKTGTRQHRDAWELAEVATRRLGDIVDAYVGVKPLIASAFGHVDQTAGEDKVAKARRR
jgi:hypothetical protein